MVATAVLFLGAVSACQGPVDASLPSTRALENGAADSLSSSGSFEVAGTYSDSTGSWSIDLQLSRPNTEHVVVSGPAAKLEAIAIGGAIYFRGQDFLAQHVGSDPVSQDLVRAAGNGWWKGPVIDVPRLPDFTDGNAFRSTFLGPVASRRTDHLVFAGSRAVDLGGVRGDVYIGADPPYRPLRVNLKRGVVVDGMTEADLKFSNFNKDFRIVAPSPVIDFSNLSTLPPIYVVMSIDTSGCASPCVLSALLRNVGGLTGAKAPSSVTFGVTDAASGKAAGACSAQIVPDVAFNATTTARCTIGELNGQVLNAAIVSATVDNPGLG